MMTSESSNGGGHVVDHVGHARRVGRDLDGGHAARRERVGDVDYGVRVGPAYDGDDAAVDDTLQVFGFLRHSRHSSVVH